LDAAGSTPIGVIFSWTLPLVLFWILVSLRIPYSVSRILSTYSAGLFLVILACYCLAFRSSGPRLTLIALTLTMLLFALTVSFGWNSGYTDTGMIGGLLPYKDAKNYYFGASQILNGLPIHAGIQAVRRPQFPGLMAALLWLAGGNLKIVLALLAQLTAVSLYFSARVVRDSFGPWAAGLFAAWMYFYIQPRIGYSVSEVGGFLLGCWAFSILWAAAGRGKWAGLTLGLATLMAAISARAGAYLIFPALIVWAGWAFRGARRFSTRAASMLTGIVVVLYALENQVFSALLDVDLTDQWGSFAYAMYGQVHGGTGWHSAIDALQSRQGSVVMASALHFFLTHPLSFFIAVAKSYRDFFLPGPFTIFSYGVEGEPVWLTYALWAATMGLLILGLIRSFANRRSNLPSLALACFVGICLSIPFLPPIDSGARFHAGSMAFFFIVPAAALSRSKDWLGVQADSEEGRRRGILLPSASAAALLILMLIAPVLIYRLSPRPSPAAPVCASSLNPFVLKAFPQAYVDVVPAASSRCGLAPEVCLADLDAHATDKNNDDFVQALLLLARNSPSGIRIIPTINLLDASFHYFVSPTAHGLPVPAGQLASGCASEIVTLNGSLYQVESVSTGPDAAP
jgi:hypothetical protein